MRKIITYQPDGFFLLLTALKFFNVAKAILKNFALLKVKITSSVLVGYLLPHPLVLFLTMNTIGLQNYYSWWALYSQNLVINACDLPEPQASSTSLSHKPNIPAT